MNDCRPRAAFQQAQRVFLLEAEAQRLRDFVRVVAADHSPFNSHRHAAARLRDMAPTEAPRDAAEPRDA